MKIAVCFKVITDYDQVPSENWRRTGLRESRFVKKNLGFFCEGALETGLRAKDKSNVYLEAISLGKEDRIFTEALYAAGYDKVTYLNADSSFDSKNTAKELSNYIYCEDFDLILTGKAVGPLETGTVPYLISNFLNTDLIDNVTEVLFENNKAVIVTENEEAICRYELSDDKTKKTIAVVSNARYPYLRFALFKDKERAKEIPSKVISANSKREKLSFEFPKDDGRNIKFILKEDFIKVFNENGGEYHAD